MHAPSRDWETEIANICRKFWLFLPTKSHFATTTDWLSYIKVLGDTSLHVRTFSTNSSFVQTFHQDLERFKNQTLPIHLFFHTNHNHVLSETTAWMHLAKSRQQFFTCWSRRNSTVILSASWNECPEWRKMAKFSSSFAFSIESNRNSVITTACFTSITLPMNSFSMAKLLSSKLPPFFVSSCNPDNAKR